MNSLLSTVAKAQENLLVLAITVELLLVQTSREDLDVTTSAVNVLLMLDRELDNQGLALVAKLGELGRNLVESVVLTSLNT